MRMRALRDRCLWMYRFVESALSESVLIKAAVAGDADALARLLQRHGPSVERGLRIGVTWRAALEAADVMQVTYLEAFLQIRNFDPSRGTPFEQWLRRIAENNLRDAIRGLQRQKQPQPADRVHAPRGEDSLIGLYNLLGSDSATPSRQLRAEEASRQLAEALGALPARYQEVVRLYDLEGRSIDEVAQATQRSPGAVHMLRARAHERLRAALPAFSSAR